MASREQREVVVEVEERGLARDVQVRKAAPLQEEGAEGQREQDERQGGSGTPARATHGEAGA